MATFARPTFSHSSYQAFRPTYPPALFTYLLSYHNSLPPSPSPDGKTLLVDLGCGPGTVTRPLSNHFTHTIGVDPSAGMIQQAELHTPKLSYPNVRYIQSGAESLPFIETSSVDIVVAAQSAHWFDFKPFFKEMSRVLKKNGTLACWGYKDHVFIDFPKATAVLDYYAYGEQKWGPYWGQPARSILQAKFRPIRPENNGEWTKVQRWEYEPRFRDGSIAEGVGRKDAEPESEEEQAKHGNTIFGELVKQGEYMLRKHMKLGEAEEYSRTWSAVHGWLEAHPEEKRRTENHPEWGDSIDEMYDEICTVEDNWGCAEGENWKEKEVDVEWGHGVVCIKRTGLGKV